MPTPAALEFVGRPTWEALSGASAAPAMWEDVDRVAHVAIGRDAAAVIVAPATADLLARAATGRADDLLTATLLTTRASVIYAPAMHTEMWEHPATRANAQTLRDRGAIVIRPDVGPLAGGDSGAGRLPHPESLAAVALAAAERASAGLDLQGRRVVIAAGGTREALDPVRYLGNRSSGRQGWALAAAAVARGAEVSVVTANVELPDPAGVDVIPVTSARELRSAVAPLVPTADVVIMVAAVADWRPRDEADSKLKKGAAGAAPTVELVQNPDVLAELGQDRSCDGARPVLVGFAAETVDEHEELVELARAKLDRKHVDLMVANRVGADLAFGSEDNEVLIVSSAGVSRVPRSSKISIANAVLDAVAARLPADPPVSNSGPR